MKITTREITMIGLSAALMGVFSQLAIPLPAVPLTLQVFGAILLAMVLEEKLATLAMVIYTLIGAMGIPVFANFSRGLSVVVGPTGGYILGFIALAFMVGKASKQKNKIVMVSMVYVGLVLQYAIGLLQLKTVLGLSLQDALVAGVYPFIIKDIILTGIAIMVALKVKKHIRGVVHGGIRA